jgi:hypothetical protein
MLFDYKHKDFDPEEAVIYAADEIHFAAHKGTCFVCKTQQTNAIAISYCDYVCSDECLNDFEAKMYAEFEKMKKKEKEMGNSEICKCGKLMQWEEGQNPYEIFPSDDDGNIYCSPECKQSYGWRRCACCDEVVPPTEPCQCAIEQCDGSCGKGDFKDKIDIVVVNQALCVVCEKSTRWASIEKAALLCSQECFDALEDQQFTEEDKKFLLKSGAAEDKLYKEKYNCGHTVSDAVVEWIGGGGAVKVDYGDCEECRKAKENSSNKNGEFVSNNFGYTPKPFTLWLKVGRLQFGKNEHGWYIAIL